MEREKNRIQNLDLMRAGAILLVVIYHSVQMDFTGYSINTYTKVGQYGVDLFFVLSGYLIGGLYWNELKKTGNVKKKRFILRRVLRTVPPYLIALMFSYLAVLMARGEKFDFGFIFFLQNYYTEIPFFLVSWSLCIEEHFYLILPFVLLFLHQKKESAILISLSLIAIIPLLLRCLTVDYEQVSEFGYYMTATHFRFEGLILGVFASYLSINHTSVAVITGKRSNYFLLITLAFLFSVPFISTEIMYYFGFTILAVLFFILILSSSNSEKPFMFAGSFIIKKIALSSYSIYLTHALVIHLGKKIGQILSLNNMTTWFVSLALIFTTGYIFYLLVEKQALKLRDKLVPKDWN